MRQIIILLGLCCIQFNSAHTLYSQIIETDFIVSVTSSGELISDKIATRSPDGTFRDLGHFKKGRPHSKFRKEDSSPPRVRYYLRTRKSKSKLITLYPNGQIRSAQLFRRGRLHGISKFWDKHGTLEQKVPYVKGAIHGLEKTYNEYGSISQKVRYVRSLKHGVALSFYITGGISDVTMYRNDELVWTQGAVLDDYDEGAYRSISCYTPPPPCNPPPVYCPPPNYYPNQGGNVAWNTSNYNDCPSTGSQPPPLPVVYSDPPTFNYPKKQHDAPKKQIEPKKRGIEAKRSTVGH